MDMFDSLPNGGQTKALGKFGRELNIGDTVKPFYNGPEVDHDKAYVYAYPYIPEFTFEAIEPINGVFSNDSVNVIYAVRNGQLIGKVKHKDRVHFNNFGESKGEINISYIEDTDDKWVKIKERAGGTRKSFNGSDFKNIDEDIVSDHGAVKDDDVFGSFYSPPRDYP